VKAEIQKALFRRFQHRLLWLLLNVLLQDVEDTKKLALAALVNQLCKILCFPLIHARMVHDRQIALFLAQPVIHAAKLCIKLKPEN